MITIKHHGAVTGVTGSCHELCIEETPGQPHAGILIDCGLFQGSEAKGQTSADNLGRIPYLLAAGFSGPILCSEPLPCFCPPCWKMRIKSALPATGG